MGRRLGDLESHVLAHANEVDDSACRKPGRIVRDDEHGSGSRRDDESPGRRELARCDVQNGHAVEIARGLDGPGVSGSASNVDRGQQTAQLREDCVGPYYTDVERARRRGLGRPLDVCGEPMQVGRLDLIFRIGCVLRGMAGNRSQPGAEAKQQ